MAQASPPRSVFLDLRPFYHHFYMSNIDLIVVELPNHDKPVIYVTMHLPHEVAFRSHRLITMVYRDMYQNTGSSFYECTYQDQGQLVVLLIPGSLTFPASRSIEILKDIRQLPIFPHHLENLPKWPPIQQVESSASSLTSSDPI